jgi:hypothetical protein
MAQTSDTKCLDAEKVKAFRALLNRNEVGRRYASLFSDTDIKIEYLSKNDESANPTELVLYEGLQGSNSRQTRTYFVLYDPAAEKMMFATLVVDRGVR